MSNFSFLFAQPDEVEINQTVADLQKVEEKINNLEKQAYTPLVERYILDELKTLRTEFERLKTELHDEINKKEISLTDKAITYSTSTLNNIFYIITASTSILVIIGWSSFKEVKEKVRSAVNEKVSILIKENEQRLVNLESELETKYKQILQNKEDIAKTNAIQSLWMRAGLEDSAQVKIEIYDKILLISPENPEVLSYKADAVLELGEPRWALNLANRALESQKDYANGYYQRACAYAELDSKEHAIADLIKALKINELYIYDVIKDKSFDNLREMESFKRIIEKHKKSEV